MEIIVDEINGDKTPRFYLDKQYQFIVVGDHLDFNRYLPVFVDVSKNTEYLELLEEQVIEISCRTIMSDGRMFFYARVLE